MPDVSSVSPVDISRGDLTVREFIAILERFPGDSIISFQVNDNVDSPVLIPYWAEHDTLFNTTDVIFEEWTDEDSSRG